MQFHTLTIFGFVLALACLMNMKPVEAKSYTASELKKLQDDICGGKYFGGLMPWMKPFEPCKFIVQKVLGAILCDCSENDGDKVGEQESDKATETESDKAGDKESGKTTTVKAL
ncbi:uncharacterized protein LOC117786668 [Drosophila innubila]|uniref:uncharacterized protein LOC117786668 n=1 Tax=Drosophila innubila TaxID=198719 RepID=UPI00148E4DAF|nr:uncharacterized protein LOC117786668 [Drosophila innubila]